MSVIVGGVRGTGFLWTTKLLNPGRLYRGSMDIADWLPTLLRLAGGSNSSLLGGIDGLDMWKALNHQDPSPRRAVLHNIDDIYGVAALTLDDWKLVKGS